MELNLVPLLQACYRQERVGLCKEGNIQLNGRVPIEADEAEAQRAVEAEAHRIGEVVAEAIKEATQYGIAQANIAFQSNLQARTGELETLRRRNKELEDRCVQFGASLESTRREVARAREETRKEMAAQLAESQRLAGDRLKEIQKLTKRIEYQEAELRARREATTIASKVAVRDENGLLVRVDEVVRAAE